jgi:hypothetical protein
MEDAAAATLLLPGLSSIGVVDRSGSTIVLLVPVFELAVLAVPKEEGEA